MLTLAGALHPRGRVDGVPEEAVPRHGEAHDARHAGARVDPHAHADVLLRPVRHDVGPDALQQVQRHGGDLARVPVVCTNKEKACLFPGGSPTHIERAHAKFDSNSRPLKGRAVKCSDPHMN